jgi:hypothetical protein
MEYNRPRFEIIANAEPRGALHTRCMVVTHMYPFQLTSYVEVDAGGDIAKPNVHTATHIDPLVARGMSKDVWKLDTPQFKTIVSNELKIEKMQSQNANLKRELAKMSTQRKHYEEVNNDNV